MDRVPVDARLHAWDEPGATADEEIETDIVIVGSGMGGATLAYALRDSGRRILVLERGDRLPMEPENSDPRAVHLRGRYKNADTWYEGRTGHPFLPGVYYYVGGNTKVYGACLPRFRRSDFEQVVHADGISPKWPFGYDELEPHYVSAERLYQVRGEEGTDPTDPPRSAPFPSPALDHEPTIRRLADSLREQGLHPFRMASAMQLDTQEHREGCTGCDGAPCETGRKADAENRALDQALASGAVRLLTGAYVRRLETGDDGATVAAALVVRNGRRLRVTAKTFVLAAGAVNSAVILLRSGNPRHPDGLANSSGLVGRNYMVHNSTFMVAIDPRRVNTTKWQKTLGINDWYEASDREPSPLGNVQMLGKLTGPALRLGARFAPLRLLDLISRRTVDLYLTTEDLPDVRNGVRLVDDRIHIDWTANNLGPHRRLVERMRTALIRAGYPFVVSKRMGIATNSHQCGTAVAGHDPATSVLDVECRAHDVDNLYVVDSAFFPSSAALNPALTIAANAFRVAPAIAANAARVRESASRG